MKRWSEFLEQLYELMTPSDLEQAGRYLLAPRSFANTGHDLSPELASVTCEGTGPTMNVDVFFPGDIQVNIDAATETVLLTAPEIEPVTNPIRAESVTWGMNGVEIDGTGDVQLKLAGEDSTQNANAIFSFLVTC